MKKNWVAAVMVIMLSFGMLLNVSAKEVADSGNTKKQEETADKEEDLEDLYEKTSITEEEYEDALIRVFDNNTNFIRAQGEDCYAVITYKYSSADSDVIIRDIENPEGIILNCYMLEYNQTGENIACIAQDEEGNYTKFVIQHVLPLNEKDWSRFQIIIVETNAETPPNIEGIYNRMA